MSTGQDQRSPADLMTVIITTSLSQVDSTSVREWFVLLAQYLPLLPLLCNFFFLRPRLLCTERPCL